MANRGCSVLIGLNSHTLGEQVSTSISRAKVQGSEHRNHTGAARRMGTPKPLHGPDGATSWVQQLV